MPFWLVYGIEAVMPMEYIMPSLRIAASTGMVDHRALEEWIIQLEELEEECLELDEETLQDGLRLQKIMNEKFLLREKSAMVEEEVKKLEEGIKRDFLDKNTVLIKQDAHDYIDKF